MRGWRDDAPLAVLAACAQPRRRGVGLQRVGDVLARVPARASGGGQLSVGVPVPNDPRVLGLTFVAQYQLTQGLTSVSEALYCTIGR